VPTLVVQGENDTFGRPEEFPSGVDLAVVPSADHGFATPKRSGVSEEDAMAIVVESALEWLVREVTGNP
jgi:predicted alpha/beta-hydrolase family hydrolase